MKKIILSNNKVSIIDDEDFEKVSKYKWSYLPLGYATRQDWSTKKFLYLHRYIINAPEEFIVDHINGDKLDNRKENLRLCSQSQNMMNRGKNKNNTSGLKGVIFRKDTKKWQAQIKLNYKNINLGSYESAIDASKARRRAEKKYYGEFAKY